MTDPAYLERLLRAAQHRSEDYVRSQVRRSLNELEADTLTEWDTIVSALDNAVPIAQQSGYPNQTLAILEAARAEARGEDSSSHTSNIPMTVLPETYQYD